MKTNDTNIILGNGFNLALFSLINEHSRKQIRLNFSYQDILENVINEIKEIESKDLTGLIKFLEQKELGEPDKNFDIEYLLWILDRSPYCLRYNEGIYCDIKNKDDWEGEIKKHRHLLKEKTITVLTDPKNHPRWNELFNNKNRELIECCGTNFKSFQRIYTTNYDLILYWVIMENNLIKKFKDGFSTPTEDENLNRYKATNNIIQLIFLHGALHLLSKSRETFKIIRGDSNDNLQDIRKKLREYNSKKKESFDNCLIFNATSNDKLIDIYRNSYLINAYEKLTTISGDLIFYGCKPPDNDHHVDFHLWEKLLNSKVKTVYIGVSSRDQNELNKRANSIAEHVRPHKHINKNIDIVCFNYNKINIWRSNDFLTEVKNNSGNSSVVSL